MESENKEPFPDAIKEIDDNLEKAWESIQILEALLKNPENNQEKALAEQLKKSKAEYFAMKESLEQDKASIKSLKKRNAVIEQKQKKKSS